MSTEGTTPAQPTTIPWKDLHAKATLVDLHAHPSLKVSLFRRSLSRATGSSRHLCPPSFRTSIQQLRDGGVDLILSAVYAPEHGLRDEFWPIHLLRLLMPCRWRRYYEGPYFDVTVRMLDDMEAQIRAHPDLARLVRNPTDLKALLAEPQGRPVAFVHCLEGAHCLDGNMGNLRALAKRGVAYLTLAHFYDNGFAPPCYPFDKKLDRPGLFDERRDPSRPLTPLGEQLISALGEYGVLPDIAHCTPVARRRVYELLGPDQGVVASHVGVQAIHPTPYNLTDDEIRTIANHGGVVGVIFMNQWLVPYETSHGLNEIVQTIRHIIKVGGVGCVAIGTDFDGFTDPPDDLKDARELPYLTCRLVAEGFTSTEIEAMIGGNALRTLLTHWRGN